MKHFTTRIILLRASVIVLVLNFTCLQAQTPSWTRTAATDVADVAVGEHNLILIVKESGELLQSTDQGQTFEPFGRNQVRRVAVGGKGAVWIVDLTGQVSSLHGSRWVDAEANGMADVAVGPRGEVACTSANGGAVWTSTDGTTFAEDRGTSDFTRVSYDQAGTLWAVGGNGSLWKRSHGRWEKTKASNMLDLAAGPQLAIWLTDKDGGVWVSNWGDQFLKVPARGCRSVAVGPDGVGWLSRGNGSLWRVDANTKAPPPGPIPPVPPVPTKPAPVPTQPAPPPAKPTPPPVKQAIRNVNPYGETKGQISFKFNTTLPVAALVEVGRRAPVGNAFKKGEIVAWGKSAGGLNHNVMVSRLSYDRETYYYLIIAGEARVTGTCGTAAPLD